MLLGAGLVFGCNDAAESEFTDAAAESADAAAPSVNSADDQPFPIRLSNVSEEAGIDTILTSGELPSTQILEVKGNGLALLDYNNNGQLDLFIPNGATMADTEHGPGWKLYENLGEMRFRDVTEDVGITQTRWALGAAVADFDGDGWQDIYVTCYGPNVLMHNTGDDHVRTFVDVTESANVGYGGWSTSAAFGDVTGDGWLDLYVTNYIEFDVNNPPAPGQFLGTEVFAGPHGLPAEPDVLYHNRGDGSFLDITQSAGIHAVAPAWGLGVVILDFDLDGRQDIYVGNDSMRNFLFHNQRRPVEDFRGQDDMAWMTFDEIGMASGIGANAGGAFQATMGIGIGDVSGNALPDVYTTNFSSDMNTLHVNIGSMQFEDRTRQHGLGMASRPFLGWACSFLDLDLDGNEELLIVNGHIYPQATLALLDSDFEQAPLLLKHRRGRGVYFDRVTDTRAGDWLTRPHRDRALVFGDINRNGLLDVIIGEMNGKPRVLRNDSEPQGDWLIVQLHQDGPNSRGLGSRIELMGEMTLHTRWIYGGGFLSANPAEAHFGASRRDTPQRIRVTWPDGYEQWVDEFEMNQRKLIIRD